VRLSALVQTSNGALVPVGPLGDPRVTAAVTTDLLRPARYLGGGELVLTGLVWWRPGHPERTRVFVAELVAAGVAALAAGEAELGRVPADVVDACAEAGLPLLRVPESVAFVAVIEHVARHVSPRRGDAVAAVLSRHRELMSAAAAGLDAVIGLVSGDLGLRCWVLTPTGRVVAGSAAAPDPRECRLLAQHYLRAPRLPHRVRRAGGRVVSLFATGDVRARSPVLAVGEDHADWDPSRYEVVAELVGLVALDQERATAGGEPGNALAAALCAPAGLVEVRAALGRAGLDPDATYVLAVGDGPDAAAVLTEVLAERSGPGRLGRSGETTVALVAGDDAGTLVAGARTVLELLAPGRPSAEVRIGVSDPVGGEGLLTAVASARAVAATVPGPGVGGPERMASHGLLLSAVPTQVRAAYRERVLGALLDHDRRHRTELVSTLATYLDCSGSWSRCAQRLHVHVNTLRYRVARIEALTGRDLRQLTDQTDLLLALRL
jgi:hypothetical protein